MSTAPEEVAEIEMVSIIRVLRSRKSSIERIFISIFQNQEEFFIRFATEMSKNIQHIVQFARNIDCFMQLKDTPRTGEADQLNLLKKGLLDFFNLLKIIWWNIYLFSGCFEILIVQISRCIRNEKILFENQFVDASFFSKLGKTLNLPTLTRHTI